MKVPYIDTFAFFMLVIGGLNAGFAALADYNIIGHLLGGGSMASTVFYVFMGLSAVYMLADRWGFLKSDA